MTTAVFGMGIEPPVRKQEVTCHKKTITRNYLVRTIQVFQLWKIIAALQAAGPKCIYAIWLSVQVAVL